MKKVTAVFDIGKTNKKFFLFDKNFKEVYKEYTRFEEIQDEDGFATENLPELQKWLKQVFHRILTAEEFEITAINFSTYGASLVHLDHKGQVLTPLYNYLKPLPDQIKNKFQKDYTDLIKIATETASPYSGMLNSGMQLYWLKQYKPKLFAKIRYSLHFPQYLSFMFTGIPVSEFTSIGCHTALWNFKKNRYHRWVEKEKILEKLAFTIPTQTSFNMTYNDKKIKIGVGIHDSSSALIPYLLGEKQPFVLISTGTWSITLNPFSTEHLSVEDIHKNCLNYLKIDGNPVRATRLFIGKVYSIQVKKLCAFFSKKDDYHKSIRFDLSLYQKLTEQKQNDFKLESLENEEQFKLKEADLTVFSSFEEALHQFMIELVNLQIKSTQLSIGHSNIKKIYIDGGFADNEIFTKLIALHFSNYKVRITKSPLGSALGAAMVISNKKLNTRFLKENYKMEKLHPPVLQTQ